MANRRKNNIIIRQPEKITIKETDALAELNPDIVIVVAYGLLLTKEFISIPKYGCINVHPSLLPEFAGGMDLNVHEEVIKSGKKLTLKFFNFAKINFYQKKLRKPS